MRKHFRYTVDGGILTEEQREFYEDNGYILIKNNASHHLLDKMQQRFIEICNGNKGDSFMSVIKDASLRKRNAEGEYLINKIQDWLYDDILFEYTSNKSIVDVIESITGPNITAIHSMLINKPPDADPLLSVHPLHQDLYYFPCRPADRIAASWTAMEYIDRNNGGLYVMPGSHKGILYPHTYPDDSTNKLYYGIRGLDHLPKVHLVMDKGDTVFFHPLLLHGSTPNQTKGFRKAISCHYADTNCYFINVRGTLQEYAAKEIEDLIVTKFGIKEQFTNLWKSKSRLVRGEPGNFQKLDSHL